MNLLFVYLFIFWRWIMFRFIEIEWQTHTRRFTSCFDAIQNDRVSRARNFYGPIFIMIFFILSAALFHSFVCNFIKSTTTEQQQQKKKYLKSVWRGKKRIKNELILWYTRILDSGEHETRNNNNQMYWRVKFSHTLFAVLRLAKSTIVNCSLFSGSFHVIRFDFTSRP